MLCRCAARTQEGVIKSLQPHTHQYRRPERFTRAENKENFPAGAERPSAEFSASPAEHLPPFHLAGAGCCWWPLPNNPGTGLL